MPEERGILHGVSWQEVCPWLCLLRVFRLAKEVPKLLLATAAIIFTAFGWWAIGYLFAGSHDQHLQAARESIYSRAPWATPDESVSAGWVQAAIAWGNRFSAGSWLDEQQIAWFAQDPFLGSWQRLSRPFWQLFDGGFTFVGFTYILLCAFWAVAVWALFGGAITRIAAVELTVDQRPSLRQALQHAASRWRSYFGAPFFPLLGMLLPIVLLMLVGWLLRSNTGLFLAAIGWPVFLAAGLFMAIVALGLVFGWPLMFATISTEGSDAFDALSRSYSYTYQRPFHYLFYAVIAMLLGVLSWVLVAGVAAVVAFLPLWGLSWTAGGPRVERIVANLPPDVRPFDWPPQAVTQVSVVTRGDTIIPVVVPPAVTPNVQPFDGLGRYGVQLIGIWLGVVKLVALAFAYSYFWTASTAIYLLLRRTTDHTELDEVYLDEQEGSYGLPTLKTDTAGVPAVDDQEPAVSDPSVAKPSIAESTTSPEIDNRPTGPA